MGDANTGADGSAGPGNPWSITDQGAGGSHGSAVAVDSAGNVYVAGNFFGTLQIGTTTLVSAGNTDIFLASFTAQGTERWAQRFGDGVADTAAGLAIDENDMLYLTGGFSGTLNLGGITLTATSGDLYVGAFSSAGAHQWSASFGGMGVDTANSVDGRGGRVCVTGSFERSVDIGGTLPTSVGMGDALVICLTSTGTVLWGRGARGRFGDLGTGVVLDGAGRVFVVGEFQDQLDFGGGPLVSTGGEEIFFVRFTAAGDHLGSAGYGGTGEDGARGLSMDPNGNLYIAGWQRATSDFGGTPLVSAGRRDIMVASYTSGGAHRWSTRFGDVNFDDAWTLDADAARNVYFGGRISGTVDFGDGTLTSQGGDHFLASLGFGGAYRWARLFSGSGDGWVRDVAVSSDGTVYATGHFGGQTDFGTGSVTTPELSAFFLLAL